MRIKFIITIFFAFCLVPLICIGQQTQSNKVPIEISSLSYKLELTNVQADSFLNLLAEHGQLMSKVMEVNEGNLPALRKAVTEEQSRIDGRVKLMLTSEQYVLYEEEIKIFRASRRRDYLEKRKKTN